MALRRPIVSVEGWRRQLPVGDKLPHTLIDGLPGGIRVDTTTTTNKTLAPFERCAVTVPGVTITLPASPSTGDEVVVSVGGFEDTEIAGNGEQIMGQTGPAVINRAWATAHLYFDGITWRLA